jgi:flagellar basal-body rod modification protein FlgD
MQVDATSAVSSTSPTSSTSSDPSSGATVDYNAFLKLLIAQLQNQDPTNPIDSTQYIAQLASFSNVEQGIRTNAKLDSLITSLALTQADGLLGRTITSADGTVSGEVASVRIVSGGAVAVLANGQEVDLGAGVTVSGS